MRTHVINHPPARPALYAHSRFGQAPNRALEGQETKEEHMLASAGRAIKEIVSMKVHFRYHVVIDCRPDSNCEYCRRRMLKHAHH
ncbi:MAG TPA: hypothetical protein VIP53_01320 [Nitrososphaera sp.]